MPFAINTWNIEPNRLWFVKLSDSGTDIHCGLYLTEADAAAGTGLQAAGSCAYGSSMAVLLTVDPAASVGISNFQSAYNYHFLVSGSPGDPDKIIRIAEFVELDEISHPIYRNADIITTRAKAEIDSHTHAVLSKDIALGSHLPTLEPGDVVRLNSTRRGKDELLQVMSHRISAEISEGGEMRLASTLTAATYLALKR